MTSGSADTSLRTELRASTWLVLATKIPLLLVLWFFELTTRPTVPPFAPTPPVALGALARWQAREMMLAVFTSTKTTDPFTGRPFAEMLPVPKGLYYASSLVADVLDHQAREIFAVITTLLLLIPAIAFLRGALPDATEREKTAASLMILAGPGMWLISSPGPVPVLLFALAAAFYGLENRKPIWSVIGAVLAPLAHPAGILVVPAFFVGPREKRALDVLSAIAAAAGLGALVGFYLIEKQYHASVALEPLHTWMSWPGGQLGQFKQMFQEDPRRPLLIHALVAAMFVVGGIALAYERLPRWLRVLCWFALGLLVRDPTSAPAIAIWCFPAALGWARLLDRVKPAQWLAPFVLSGVAPIFLFAFGNVWDFLDFGPARPQVGGEIAAAAQRVPGLGYPADPAAPLGNGKWQRFDLGAVHCSPSFGCHAIEGEPYARFLEAGGIAACGAPSGDRYREGDTWIYPFEHGVVRSRPGSVQAVCGSGR